MTKAMMAMEAEKAELARIVLELDDMDLVRKVRAALKRIVTPKEDPFFTNPANLEHFRRSVKQRENVEVIEMSQEDWKHLLLD